MSDMFNIRSFVGNQVDKLSSPKNLLVDKFRQTVDTIKLPFGSPANVGADGPAIASGNNDASPRLRPSESSSSSSVSSNEPTSGHLLVSLLPIGRSTPSPIPATPKLSRLLPSSSPLSSPKILSNFKTFTDRLSRGQSILRRHVSESNPSDEPNFSQTINDDDKSMSQPIYHNNPSIDVNLTSNDNRESAGITDAASKFIGRSRSLIRQSTDTTCTFPIRRPMRRMESIETVEIPGLNGVKSIRYLNDNLGRLQPDLYTKPTCQTDPSYGFGKLSFTLFYNSSLTALMVNIVSIDNLPYREPTTKVSPDPFIKITLLPDRRRKFQTKVYKRSQSTPVNEAFQFPISYEELARRILLLSVYDFGRSSKRSLIGTVKVEDFASMAELTSHDVTCSRSIVPGTEVSRSRRDRMSFRYPFVLFCLLILPIEQTKDAGNEPRIETERVRTKVTPVTVE